VLDEMLVQWRGIGKASIGQDCEPAQTQFNLGWYFMIESESRCCTGPSCEITVGYVNRCAPVHLKLIEKEKTRLNMYVL
jgi:hypothetical protein